MEGCQLVGRCSLVRKHSDRLEVLSVNHLVAEYQVLGETELARLTDISIVDATKDSSPSS